MYLSHLRMLISLYIGLVHEEHSLDSGFWMWIFNVLLAISIFMSMIL